MINYKELNETLKSLINGNKYEISILSNASSLINDYMENTNWVGFYLNKNNTLYLGPFQGHPACIEIPFNKGVCGACASSMETIIVPNVREFKGHIACDSNSRSEICVPIMVNGKLYGLIDIDSPQYNNFNISDKIGLEETSKIISLEIEKLID